MVEQYPEWIHQLPESTRQQTMDSWKRAFIDTGMAKKAAPSERLLQKRLAVWMRTVHPKVRFHTSLDGERLAGGANQGQNIATLQWGSGFPDFMIYCNRGDHCGIALELKKDTPFKRDGSLKKSDRLTFQQGWLDYLNQNGWIARFCWEQSVAEKLINEYVNAAPRRN